MRATCIHTIHDMHVMNLRRVLWLFFAWTSCWIVFVRVLYVHNETLESTACYNKNLHEYERLVRKSRQLNEILSLPRKSCIPGEPFSQLFAVAFEPSLLVSCSHTPDMALRGRTFHFRYGRDGMSACRRPPCGHPFKRGRRHLEGLAEKSRC